jgi:hypothetical protein
MTIPLSTTITNLDHNARTTALKALGGSCLARAIGSIRQQIRNDARKQRNIGVSVDEFTRFDKERASHNSDLDQRNHADALVKGEGEIAARSEGVETAQPATPMENANTCYQIYEWANGVIETISLSLWDRISNPQTMLANMLERGSRGIPDAVLCEIASAIGTDIATLRLMQEVNDKNDRLELAAQLPEINNYLSGMSGMSGEDSLDSADPILQHQLGVRVTKSLNEEQNRQLAYILRSGKMSELANITFLKNAILKMTEWVAAWEKKHRVVLHEAIDAGRTIHTL